MCPDPSNHINRARELAQERHLHASLKEQFAANQTDVYVLSVRELTDIWMKAQKARGKPDSEIESLYERITGFTLGAILDYTGPASDFVVLSRLGADMHRSGTLFAKYRVIQRQGQSLIVLSGYAGLRKHLTAPVYGIGHPKVIKMGIGQAAAKGALKSGAVLTLILSPVVRTLEWLFTDELKTMEAMLAHIATDIAKGLIAAGAAYFTAGVVPTALSALGFSVVAVIPVFAGIVVAIGAGLVLNWVDNSLGLTEKLTDALMQHKESWVKAMEENKRSIDQVRKEANYYFGSTRGGLDFMRRFAGSGGW